MDDEVIGWISSSILPHEADVRRWLRRDPTAARDADDIIQESYSRIARGARPDEIRNGRAYFFRVVRNLLIERVRRQKLVRIEAMAEIDATFVVDDGIPADRQIQDREELSYVMSLLDQLPERSRAILMLRRIEGLSQRETAQRLGVTENVVEKQTAVALKKLLAMIRSSADIHGYEPREAGIREHRRNIR